MVRMKRHEELSKVNGTGQRSGRVARPRRDIERAGRDGHVRVSCFSSYIEYLILTPSLRSLLSKTQVLTGTHLLRHHNALFLTLSTI